MNTYFPAFRIAFAAAAAIAVFLIVHGALDNVSRTAEVLTRVS